MITPRYFSRTLAAGASARISVYGRHILIASISASSFALGIDDDPPHQLIPGEHIDCEDHKYAWLFVTNIGLVPGTIVFKLADTWIDLNSDGGILAGIAASLVSIDQELSGAATVAAGQLADTICAQTGVGTTTLFAANANRTEVEIKASLANGAEIVYLGFAAAHCTAADKFYELAAGDVWWSNREKGAIIACSDLGTGVAFGSEK